MIPSSCYSPVILYETGTFKKGQLQTYHLTQRNKNMGHFKFTDAEKSSVTAHGDPSLGTDRRDFLSSEENSHRLAPWDGSGWACGHGGSGYLARLGLVCTVTVENLARDSHDPE